MNRQGFFSQLKKKYIVGSLHKVNYNFNVKVTIEMLPGSANSFMYYAETKQDMPQVIFYIF